MNNTSTTIFFALRRFSLVCLAVTVVACEFDSQPAVHIEFRDPPEISGAPNPNVPLVAIVTVVTDPPTSIEIVLWDGAGHTFMVESSESASSHNIPILGLKADRTYEVQITAIHISGSRSDWAEVLTLDTPPLPDSFPLIQVRKSIPNAMEPGFTLFSARHAEFGSHFVVIVDEIGDVVWYAEDNITRGVVMLENGNLLVGRVSPIATMEYTLLGEVVSVWYAAQSEESLPGDIPVDVFSIHHDTIVMPSGNFLAVSREIRTVDNFPVDELDPNVSETQDVLDDPIVEFRRDGTVVEKWRQLDLLKPTRIGFDATKTRFFNSADWGHTNAVWYDPKDDSFITSVRQQDAVVKISRATGELIWILGNHDNWGGFEQYLLSPIGSPFEWQWHQHAPMVTSSGTVLLFDNANFRASPFTGDPILPASANYSRAVEYRVDEDAMTIEQVWEWGLSQSGEQLYAPFVGDADELPVTGNVLIDFAGLCTIDGVPSDSIPLCHKSMRIIEIERGSTDRVVFDLLIDDPETAGWIGYRADRIAALYPD